MDELKLEIKGHCAWLTIARPTTRNAMSLVMWRALPGLIERVSNEPAARVFVLQGSHDRVFSAGADIEEIEQHSHDDQAASSFMGAVENGTDAIVRCAIPTIAMIRGDCIGGGIEMAMACDLRFASRASRFGVPPAKLGVLYSFASTKRLVDLVGPGKAKDLLFSGRMFDAAEAYSMGLIERLSSPEDIIATTTAYADLLSQRSQASIRGAKQIVAAISDGLDEENDHVRRLRIDTFLGEDLKQGVRAFFEKRTPSFK
jgi:enoyl-CoA hydratase